MNDPLTPEQWVTAREFAAKVGAGRPTLQAFDDQIRDSRRQSMRLNAVKALKSLIAGIEAGTLEPVRWESSRGAIEGVSPCGQYVTHEPAKETHHHFTFRHP